MTPLEYAAHRHFGYLARHLDGAGGRFAALCQSIDELRHAQTETHTISQYNKYYGGMHNFAQMHDRVWYLSVPKSFFEDGMSAGPFEFLTAISFSFEYLLTNLLFVPFMSGASFNGDLATMTFGFSAQSDESRHMTLGLEVIKFMLEQDEANVPIVQDWIDKWFWRGYRLLGLVAAMMDYMLPKKIMSWKEAFELYLEKQMLEGLFPDLEYYGIRPPRHIEQAIAEKEYMSHQVYWILYQFSHAANFNTTVPPREELDWMSQVYPDTFDRYYRPLWERARSLQEQGKRFFFQGLPMLCQVCQIPMALHRAGRPVHGLRAEQPVPRRAVQLLLRRMQVDLRPGAGEVRAGVAARAPDLPGQLRGHVHSRGAGLVRHPGRGRQRRVPDVAGQDQLGQVALGCRGGGRMMAVKALYDYDFPSKDRQEVFGDDILVNVLWTNNMMFASAACFRAPKAMSWADFKSQMIDTWAASDPDYDPSAPGGWQVNGEDFSPADDTTLDDTGVGHKGLVTFRT